MIKGNNKKRELIIGIIICLIGLAVCITIDSATETITNIDNKTTLETTNATIINETSYMGENNGIATTDGKLYTNKNIKENKPKKKTKKHNTITMTGKPSCTSCVYYHRAYKWSTHTYLNYCPNCHHYNCLYDAHKSGSVHEKEISCRICDSDFCIRCGKEKYSWSHVHLKKI